MMARLVRRVDKVFDEQEGHLFSRMGTAHIEMISEHVQRRNRYK